jgi:hypothetical protein
LMIQDNPSVRVAERFLELLHHKLAAGDRIETRDKAPGEHGQMRRKFFASTDEAAKYAGSVGYTRDVYVGVAARRGEDGTRKGVHRISVLWADLDAKNGHTREGRLHQLKDLHCYPSMLVWSGGGWHTYWLLWEPVEGPEELERAELVMRCLAKGLGGDPVHDRSRILRVPGTHNHKRGEPRAVHLEHCDPELRYGLDEIEKMAEALPRKVDGDSQSRAGKVRRDILSDPIGKGERNGALVSIGGSLRDRGLDSETICVVLLEVNRLRCEPPLGEQEVVGIGRSVSKYAAGSPRYRSSLAQRLYRKEVC